MKSFLVLVTLLMSLNAVAAESPSGTVVWFDIRVSDSVKSESFYGRLFGWEFQEIFPGYKMISAHGKGIGGLSRDRNSEKGNQGTMIYFRVENLKRSYANAIAFGAKGELGPSDIPNFGSYAVLRDPDNNQIALFSEKPLRHRTRN